MVIFIDKNHTAENFTTLKQTTQFCSSSFTILYTSIIIRLEYYQTRSFSSFSNPPLSITSHCPPTSRSLATAIYFLSLSISLYIIEPGNIQPFMSGFFFFHLFPRLIQLGMVVHTFNLSTQETEAEGSLS